MCCVRQPSLSLPHQRRPHGGCKFSIYNGYVFGTASEYQLKLVNQWRTHHVRAHFRFGTENQFALLIRREFFAGQQLGCRRWFNHVMSRFIQHTKSVIMSVNCATKRKIHFIIEYYSILLNSKWSIIIIVFIIVIVMRFLISHFESFHLLIVSSRMCGCVYVSVKHF